MESHQVHVAFDGALHQFTARFKRSPGGKIEAILPAGLLQVQGMYGGIAEIEQSLPLRFEQHGEMSGSVAGRGNHPHPWDDLAFIRNRLDLMSQRSERAP